VRNLGSDRSQVANAVKVAKEAIGTRPLDAVADRGRTALPQLEACEWDGTVKIDRSSAAGSRARHV